MNSVAGVTFDASGNLWGTTVNGVSNSDGDVFEIAKGTSTVIPVASFTGYNGQYPQSAVTFDASGNLWGTTPLYDGKNDGNVYEIVKGSNTITSIAVFNGSNGAVAQAPVIFDAGGNLWGTTASGGASNDGTVFEILKGSSTISTVATFNGSNGKASYAAVAFDSSGDIWGTTQNGGAANAGTVWELPISASPPAWLSDPAGNDTWNSTSHTLIVNDPSTIIADPGSDQPIIQASGSSAVVTMNPSSALQIHLGGLSLANGASAIVTSLGAARTATNHRVLVLGQPGATSAPLFSIDAASKLDLTDNDLVDHDGSLSGITGLLTSGRSGDGLISSKAGGSSLYTLGVGQPASAGTFDSETVGTLDVELRYTYYGDANLDGHVDASDYSKIDFGFLHHSTGWSNGDFNYDGVINGSDYTLIDNAFNTQTASLAALVSPLIKIAIGGTRLPSATSAASGSKTGGVRPTIGEKAIGRSLIESFAPDVFNTATPVSLTESTPQNIELSFQKRDLLDQLSFA